MHGAGVMAAAALAAGLTAPAAAQELGHPAPTSLFGVPVEEIAALPAAAAVEAAVPRGKPEGSAVAHCKAGPAGELSRCELTLARGAAFGPALLGLAPQFRLRPDPARSADTDVVITASWPVADIPADWQVQPKPGDFATNSTPASWRLHGPGMAVLNCLLGKLGTTYGCAVIYQEPSGKGFGEMTLRFGPFLKLKPAQVAGQPVRMGVNIVFHFAAAEAGNIY